jgi:PPOX class probable F420-dependent enzyme
MLGSTKEATMSTQARTTHPFSDFEDKRYMLVTTFKKDGTPVPTPVGTYMIGDRLFFLTDPRSGKAKRIRRNPRVTVTPCSLRGAPKGHTHHARAWVLDMDEAEKVAHAYADERPIAYHLGRLIYDLRGKSAIFVELAPRAYPPPGPISLERKEDAA